MKLLTPIGALSLCLLIQGCGGSTTTQSTGLAGSYFANLVNAATPTDTGTLQMDIAPANTFRGTLRFADGRTGTFSGLLSGTAASGNAMIGTTNYLLSGQWQGDSTLTGTFALTQNSTTVTYNLNGYRGVSPG